MTLYDTTATCQQDAFLLSSRANQNNSAGNEIRTQSSSTSNQRIIISFKMPDKPTSGADNIDRILYVMTQRSLIGTSSTRTYPIYKVTKLWQEENVTWNDYDTGLAWGASGGDLDEQLAVRDVSSSAGATFAWDISKFGYTWADRGTIIIKDSVEDSAISRGYNWYSLNYSSATVALWPHIVIRFEDLAPVAITDLTVTPDTSLSEASYTFRQRAVLNWTASDADDFSRYRIRFGVNRSLAANHTHKAFISSRASNSYLDTTLYTASSTIYYSVYVEDTRNQSASTNANVSNIVSWLKPDALVGSVSIGSSASTLQEIEARVRTTTMANGKKAKIVWGDNAYTFSENLTSAGGYFYARHRYTKATSGYTIRAQVEDINGFRSAPDSYGTSVTISNLGPVAKIIASPSRQRTAGTFSAGQGPSSNAGPWGGGSIFIEGSNPAPSDGVVTRFKTRASVLGTGVIYAQIWRSEGAKYRCIYSDVFTLATANANLGRTVNWNVKKGDYVGIQVVANAQINTIPGGSQVFYFTAGTAATPGATISRWNQISSNSGVNARASLAYTNPLFFSSKDSFARGSNKFINRFRWDTDYNGTFGSDFETGATTSFYYAWTTATTQFVAVRAVDNSHSSSIDIAGVVIETESTFRFPNDLRDGVNSQIRDARSRAYTHSYTLSKDGGSLDLGSLGPRSLMISGTAYSKSTSASTYIDIERIGGVFQQRKRCYVQLPGKSTSSALQGYVVDAPNVYSTDDPDAAGWDLTVAVAS